MNKILFVILAVTLFIIMSCYEKEEPQPLIDLIRIDTVYLTDTLIVTKVDTVKIVKEISRPDIYDVYVLAMEMIDSQFTGEIKLYSNFYNSKIRKEGDIYTVNLIVQWFDGQTNVQSDVSMNIQYFGDDPKDARNYVRTWFGQVPRCYFRTPCGK